MDEETLKQINRLAFENGRMRFLIGEAITTMNHAETFIRSREKMHRTGIDLWCELVNRLQECLDDQNKRCAECGGSLPMTGRNDATGECSCQSLPQNLEGPADLCPQPAPGLAIDSRGVLVRQDDKDDMTKEYEIYERWTK